MTDEYLLRRAQSGNRDALNVLIQKYYDSIYRYCYHHTGNPHEAEDICQDTFISVIEHISCIARGEKMQNYLYTVARNKCTDFFRKKKTLSLEQICDDAISEADFADALAIKNMVNRLPEEFREVILLRYYQDLPYRDIAKILRIHVSLAKYRLKRGIELLKEGAL